MTERLIQEEKKAIESIDTYKFIIYRKLCEAQDENKLLRSHMTKREIEAQARKVLSAVGEVESLEYYAKKLVEKWNLSKQRAVEPSLERIAKAVEASRIEKKLAKAVLVS